MAFLLRRWGAIEPGSVRRPEEDMNLQASPAPAQSDTETVIGALQTMIDHFLARLPYIAVAVLVFVVLYLVAKGVRWCGA